MCPADGLRRTRRAGRQGDAVQCCAPGSTGRAPLFGRDGLQQRVIGEDQGHAVDRMRRYERDHCRRRETPGEGSQFVRGLRGMQRDRDRTHPCKSELGDQVHGRIGHADRDPVALPDATAGKCAGGAQHHLDQFRVTDRTIRFDKSRPVGTDTCVVLDSFYDVQALTPGEADTFMKGTLRGGRPQASSVPAGVCVLCAGDVGVYRRRAAHFDRLWCSDRHRRRCIEFACILRSAVIQAVYLAVHLRRLQGRASSVPRLRFLFRSLPSGAYFRVPLRAILRADPRRLCADRILL